MDDPPILYPNYPIEYKDEPIFDFVKKMNLSNTKKGNFYFIYYKFI